MGDLPWERLHVASSSGRGSHGSELARAPRHMQGAGGLHSSVGMCGYAIVSNRLFPACFAFWQFPFLGKLNMESCVLRALRNSHLLFPTQENLVWQRGIIPLQNRVCMAAINNIITEPDNK